MTDSEYDFDVAIIGAGPTGLMAALKLGQEGVRVCVLERRDEPFTTPRAIAYDAELLRNLQTTGCYDDVNVGMIHDLPVKYFNEKGKLLWAFSHCPSAFGFPSRGTYYQPTLEKGLQNGVARLGNVMFRRGVDVETVEQDAKGVTLNHTAGTVTARYVLACDGGSSATRQRLGISFSGKTFSQKWLVIDTLDDTDKSEDLQFFCNPHRPALSLPNAGRRRRWEFLVMPGDDEAELVKEANVRALVHAHGGAAGFGIERSLIYTFHARYAGAFRKGRVFLAGDAAHVMPPFAGQGLTSGVRDAVNLGWKLAGVCKGIFSDAILDSYEAERRPHIEKVTEFAVRLGGLIMTTSPLGAFFRDRLMNLIWAIPATRNFIDRNDPIPPVDLSRSELVRRGAHRKVGRLIEQPSITTPRGETVPFDALLGTGFALVGIGMDPNAALGAEDKARLARLGVRLVALDTPNGAGRDQAGMLSGWFGRREVMVLVRPDRIVADVLDRQQQDNRLKWLDNAYSLVPEAGVGQTLAA